MIMLYLDVKIFFFFKFPAHPCKYIIIIIITNDQNGSFTDRLRFKYYDGSDRQYNKTRVIINTCIVVKGNLFVLLYN